MKYKDYSDDIWTRINATLDHVLKQDPAPVAAFDADGTLWDLDLGETFFHHQIDNKLVSLPPHPWSHYEQMKAENPQKAYLWLAQICQGYSLEQVQQWAQDGITAASPLPLFLEQKRLIDLFVAKGVQIFIVTASVKWAVEPGAEIMGLSKDHVLGIETQVQNGLVTDQQKGPITYREGKVAALLERTQGKYPFFASGNTMGDFKLLESATHLRLAVSAASRDDKIFRTESELQQNAEQRAWMTHRFI